MKKNLCSIKKMVMTCACLGMSIMSVNAASYTAIVSGNFSSSATWGGTAPSQVLSNDVVIIPSGVTVTLDQTATFNGTLSSLAVMGSLVSANNSALIMSSGSLLGSGTIMVDSMALGLASGFSYTGAINAQNFTSTGASISSAASVTVSNTLRLMNGTLNIAAGSLSLSNNATIVVSNGNVLLSGGSLGLTSNYNLRYEGSSNITTGLELMGSGLTDVELNMGSGAVTLSSDLNMEGSLMLTSGTLVLDGNDLSFSGNGSFSAGANGNISSTNGSNITIASSGSLGGTLTFATGGNTVNNLTINLGSSTGSVMVGSDLMVDGQLSLQSGRLNIGSNELTVGTGGSISGGSSSSFVVTGKGGMLTLDVAAGTNEMFYVGTSSNFAPATVTANSGSTGGMVSVSVNDTVFVNGSNGATLSANQPMVNTTWYVTSTATSNINMNLDLMWSSNMEANSFNRNTAYISHYVNGSWDMATSASATTTTNGMFKLSRNNITSLSPFAVVDEDAITTSVNDFAAAKNAVIIYPNPATEEITFQTAVPANVAIYNMTGQLVKTAQVANSTTISISELPVGTYTAHFHGKGDVSVQKFTKQ